MGRLTKQMKQDIVDAVADDVYIKRDKEFLKLENILANQIMDDAIGPRYLKKMAELPVCYFQSYATIDVEVKTGKGSETEEVSIPRLSKSNWKGRPRHRMETGHGNNKLQLGKSRVQPKFMSLGGIVLSKGHPLAKALRKYAKDREQFGEEVMAAVVKVNALLESVNTDKKLFEIWPEAKKYMPKPEPVAKLPTVRGDEVNKLIHCVKSSEGCD